MRATTKHLAGGALAFATAVGERRLRRLLRDALRGRDDAVRDRDEALRHARVLARVARELSSTLDPELLVEIAVKLSAEIASPPGHRPRRANYCRISDGLVRVDAEHDGEGRWLGACWPLTEHVHLERAVRTRRPTCGALDPDTLGPTVLRLAREQGVGHGAWVPVVVGDVLHGVVAVAGRNGPVSERELRSCVAIVEIMELALANALAHRRTELAALTDPLTSLSNRRGLDRLVDERRARAPMAVLAIDIDDLKAVNDRYGHATGDELIVTVASAISSVLRAGDALARVGGDEFALTVFASDEGAGERVAARMLAAVAEAVFPAAPSGRPRISIGVACAEPGAPLHEALARADAAMYDAKRAGGMQVRTDGQQPPRELAA
ncbi:MAG: diguanylate cyclase domain-containing protein [Solirubrobacteraceae bacterium]